MTGRHINDHQVRLYMTHRQSDTLAVAAARSCAAIVQLALADLQYIELKTYDFSILYFFINS